MARKGRPRKPDPVKICRLCEAPIIRRYLPCGKLERHQDFLTRQYCSRRCSSAAIALNSHQIRESRGEPVVIHPLAPWPS